MATRAPSIAMLITAVALLAQQPSPPAPPEAPGGVFRLPPAYEVPKEAPKQEEPKRPVLENKGVPIQLEVNCTDEDMTTFGMACSEDHPCPVYAQLVSVLPVGAKVFVTGNLHDGTTTMYSLLLVSEDAGKTWTEPLDRQKGIGFDQIQFIDFEVGWISGQSLGVIPRDPFFLITSDGGKTWRKRPVFSESRVSTVERFWFDSRTNGSMIVDRVQGAENNARYELYETLTGGDSWMVRQVSPKPLPLKGAQESEASTGWRLRADAKSKAYVIERREGTRRLPVAAFLIQAGECKPNPAPLPEPPPPPEPDTVAPEPPAKGPVRQPSLKKP